MLESMGVVEPPSVTSPPPKSTIRWAASPFHLVTSSILHPLFSLNPHPTIAEKSQAPGTKQMKRRGPLVPSVPCVLVIAGYLEAYCIMRGGRGRENTDKTTSVTMNLLTSIYLLPWHFSLSLHHGVTGRKHFSWKAVLLLCILWWRGNNYWEEKRKEQKMKGWASRNYSLKCSCTIPDLHQHSLSLAAGWRCLSGTHTSRNKIQKPAEPGQVPPERWAVLSTLRRCRDTPPRPPQVKPLHTASREEPSKNFCICFTYSNFTIISCTWL